LPLNGIIGGTTNSQYSDTELLILVTPRLVEMAPRKDHTIYAGRGQLGGATSLGLGPSIQERRGGFQLPPSERQQPIEQQPQPQPEPQVPQPPTEPQQYEPPANTPPQPNTPN
jgi:hypothetical protein